MRQNLSGALVEIGEERSWNWDLIPQQGEFLRSNVRNTLLSGGFGSGKTTVLVTKTLLLLFGIPNNLGYLGRMDGKALRASTMQVFRDMLPKEYVEKWNDQSGSIKLKPQYGGSSLLYGDFKDINDLKNIPLGFFAIDQMEEITEEVFQYIAGRLRRRVPLLTENGLRQYTVAGPCTASGGGRHYAWHGDAKCRTCQLDLPTFRTTRRKDQDYPDWDLMVYPNYGIGVANPEGPSHWLFQYFPGLEGPAGLISGGKGKDYKAWNITTFDALQADFVGKAYVDNLVSIYSSVPHMYDRYLLGKWVEAEGLVYPGFTMEHHILDRNSRRFDDTPLLNPDYQLYEWIDHGFSAPTAIGWVYVEQCTCGCGRPNYILIDESYTVGLAAYSAAAIIKNKRAQWGIPVAATYIDSAVFNKNQTRTIAKDPGSNENVSEIYSVADQYIEHDIIPLPGQKDWGAGFDRITENLAFDPKHRHLVTGELNAPHWYVFSHCKNFIKEVTTYKWKKKKGTNTILDEPVDDNDHHMDAWYTFMASHPEAFTQYQAPIQKDWDFDDTDSQPSHMSY